MIPSTVCRTLTRVCAPITRTPLVATSVRAITTAATSATVNAVRLTSARSGRWFTLGAAATVASVAAYTFSTQAVENAGESGLNPKEFVPFKLAKRVHYNHNTDLFIFELKDKNASINLPVSSYIVTRFKGADGKDVIRPYTPIDQHIKGELHLLVKNYPAGVMSKHIHELKVGDSLDIKGPLPKYPYKPNTKKQIGMIAGGTGITPMLQIIEEIVSNPDDKTEINLVFANTSTKDILLKEKIESLAKAHKNLKVTYVIDKPEAGFNGPTGYINSSILKPLLPKPTADNLVFVCGPPGFMKVTSGPKTPDYKQGELEGALKELGFNSDNVFKL